MPGVYERRSRSVLQRPARFVHIFSSFRSPLAAAADTVCTDLPYVNLTHERHSSFGSMLVESRQPRFSAIGRETFLGRCNCVFNVFTRGLVGVRVHRTSLKRRSVPPAKTCPN